MWSHHSRGMTVGTLVIIAGSLGTAACRVATSGPEAGKVGASASSEPASTAVTTTTLGGDAGKRPASSSGVTRSSIPVEQTTTSVPASPPAAATACLTGTFTTVFGGPTPVYTLTDAGMARTEIVLDAGVADGVGGPLALDRHKVTVRGEPFGSTATGMPRLRATEVQLGEGGCG